jgi:tetratricopeptide (TPR) repeat protein
MAAPSELPAPTGHREVLVTIALIGIATIASVAVFGLVNRFRAWEHHLAEKLYHQGDRALHANVPAVAIDDFRSALSFDEDNDRYQFSLAQALEADRRAEEARSYLLDLWERKPQDGAVNLELGRLSAQQTVTDRALRYYHNAIYGLWDKDPEANRHRARVELINYLLQRNERTQAESEIIAMQAGLPADPTLRAQVGSLFARIQEYDRALDQYRRALDLSPRNVTALAGAGESAFQLGHFRSATRYLRAAVAQDPQNDHSRQLLQTASIVLDASPFEKRLSARDRQNRLRTAFDIASKKLLVCMDVQNSKSGDTASSGTSDTHVQSSPRLARDLEDLSERYRDLQQKVRRRAFLDDPDSVDQLMDYIVDVEQRTPRDCGPSTPMDHALILIAKYRSGVDR